MNTEPQYPVSRLWITPIFNDLHVIRFKIKQSVNSNRIFMLTLGEQYRISTGTQTYEQRALRHQTRWSPRND
jgi:hypothetical protein